MIEFAQRILTAPLGRTWLFAAGQAGFIIKSAAGRLLAIDLYLSDCVERVEGSTGFRRMLPKLLTPEEIEFNVVIATHYHKDHFDDDIMPELIANGYTKLYAARDCRDDVVRLGMEEKNITYVSPGEKYKDEDFELTFTECDHGSGAPQAVGVIVAVDGKKIYEAGDTCLRMDRIPDLRKKGPFDVVIGPINGAFGNMNETEYARFAHELGGMIIPCHYGMFPLHGGNPGLFYKIMTEEYPDDKFRILTMGERYQV